MKSIPPSFARRWAAQFLSVLLLLAADCCAQDNVLIYGNSIVFTPTVPFFKDLVAQTGAPMPNVVEFIGPDRRTGDYVNQIGLITSSLPPGQTWKAMIVEGGTVENVPTLGNPAAFQANMLTLANAFFAHSPNGLFVGHETGADHPSGGNYPTVAPNAATWLGWSHTAYVTAAQAITAAHPGNPAARIAPQGTCFASTTGYAQYLYFTDLHHLSVQGKILCAMLWYVSIYGGRIEEIPVDFTSTTPLVVRLNSYGIDEPRWRRLVGFADSAQPPAARPFPGSSGDFQIRSAVGSTLVNLLTKQTATAGSTLRLQPFSPLGSLQNAPAAIYGELVPTGSMPNGGTPPELWLNPLRWRVVLAVTNLNGAPIDITIPPVLVGQTMWIQAVSRGPTSGLATYSDAQLIRIL